MTRPELIAFMRKHQYAVLASLSATAGPQAATVGIVVSDQLELFFDTLASTRKCQNLRADPRVAFVIGTDGPATVQLEGTADEPVGATRDRLMSLYLERFPEGRERQAWPGITYFRVRPTWIRFSDFGGEAPVIEHFTDFDFDRAGS